MNIIPLIKQSYKQASTLVTVVVLSLTYFSFEFPFPRHHLHVNQSPLLYTHHLLRHRYIDCSNSIVVNLTVAFQFL